MTRAADAPSLTPPAGTYPSGHEGFAREWDGTIWTGPALADATATPAHQRHPFVRRLPFWLVVIGIVVGLALVVIGSVQSPALPILIGVGGALATAGALAALALGVHRRLGLGALPLAKATVWGILSGLVAAAIARVVEASLLGPLLGAKAGQTPPESLYLLAGPVEELAKLLVPLILMLVAGTYFARARIGVWTVLLSASVFGAIEAFVYSAGLSPVPASTARATASIPGLGADGPELISHLAMAIERMWVELGHPLWTTGAAVLIVLAVHRGRHVLGWTTLGAYLAASALHSFNDGVLTLLPGALPALASIVWITLGYVLWFRPLVRRLVPPDAVLDVRRRWVPPLPKA